jgi:hypothetical protein
MEFQRFASEVGERVSNQGFLKISIIRIFSLFGQVPGFEQKRIRELISDGQSWPPIPFEIPGFVPRKL